jgi:hypothetical protein
MTMEIKIDNVGRAESTQYGKVFEIASEDEILNAMGYEQHMKRGFNFWSMTAFCLTGLGLLPSLGGMCN